MGSSSTNSIAATGFHYDVWNCDHLGKKFYCIADADADEKFCVPPDYAAALMDRHSQEAQTPSNFDLFDEK